MKSIHFNGVNYTMITYIEGEICYGWVYAKMDSALKKLPQKLYSVDFNYDESSQSRYGYFYKQKNDDLNVHWLSCDVSEFPEDFKTKLMLLGVI